MTTVKTLLDIPALRLRVRAGGDLLDRAVTRIYGTELADPGRYVSAGEFVLSGLLWWKGPGDAEPFVAALAKAGAAALAASGADTGGIPGDLIEACDRHRIPLLEAPADLSFAVITERVVLALAAGSQSARKRLLSVAAEDASLDALVEHGSAELGAPCWVLSATGRVVAGSGDLPPVSTLVQRFVAARGLPTHVDDYELTPIGGRHAVPWLLAVRRDLVPAAHDVIDELAGLIGLARSRDDEVRRVSDRIAEPLIELLAGSGDPAGAFGSSGLSGHIRVLVARTPDAREGRGLLADLLADHPGRVLLGESDEDAYALIEDHPAWPGDWASTARRSLSTVEPLLLASRVLIGIGGPAPLSALRGASEEARHAVTAASLRPGVVEVVAGEQVGMHRLLLAGAPDELRSALRQRVLGPLLDYDAEQHGDLVHTIRVYLECSSSPARAAKALHVHVNTLRYRVAKASELLGVDLTEFTQQVDVYLALKAES